MSTAKQIIEEGRPGAIVTVPVIEWWDLLTRAVPPDDIIKANVLRDLKTGCENAAQYAEVGILADQGKMILAMIPEGG